MLMHPMGSNCGAWNNSKRVLYNVGFIKRHSDVRKLPIRCVSLFSSRQRRALLLKQGSFKRRVAALFAASPTARIVSGSLACKK